MLTHLPEYLQAPLRFAFITGWRLCSEVLPMTAAQVDLQTGVVRLEVGTTKNHDGRSFYLDFEVQDIVHPFNS